MRKLWTVLFFLPLLAFYIPDWVNVKIDDRTSLSFPSQPVEKESNGNPVWIQDAGNDARFMLMVIDFKNFGLDSAKVDEEMGKEEAFDDFKESFIGKLEGAKLISEKNVLTKGKRTFEYKVDLGTQNQSGYTTLYNKNIFIGEKLYSLSFYEKANNPQDVFRKKFFESFIF